MMKKRVITWTLAFALLVSVPAFGIFGIPSPEDLLIWFVLRPIMHGNQRAMIANQLEQLRQLVEQLQTARSQLTHVTDSVHPMYGGFTPIADPGRPGRELTTAAFRSRTATTMMTPVMMLQLVPTIPTDPAAAPDPATVVSGIMDQVILAAAPQVHAAGLDLWRRLAAILIVWTGLRIAFTGDFRPWDIVRVVIALWFPWAMLTFYHDPLPGSTRSFTEAITDGGQWLQLILIQNTGEDFLVTFSRLSQNLFARAQSMELGTGGGIMDMLINGLTDLSYLLMSFIHTIIFELFLLFILLCLVVIYGVSMAQVLWAQLALGVLVILGPLFIPFLLVEPLAFLFWGWFKSMFTYTLYGAIAAALMRVFLAASIGWMNAIVNGPPPDTNMLWHSTAWFLSIVPLTIAGLLSSLMIGQLASQITGGGAGGGNHGHDRPGRAEPF